MKTLTILSGGAAQGLVGSLAQEFKGLSGLDIVGEFGAVGAMAEKLKNGTPADVVILTAAIVAKLAREQLVVEASITDVGRVETALAVRASDAQVAPIDAATLKAALLAADAIFMPDIKASTAGLHVAKVLEKLGIAEDVADRLKIFPNGATAMRQLAASKFTRPIGCTQSTEIINTPGVVLSGCLPPGFELSTVYTAAVTTQSGLAPHARALIALLTEANQQPLRTRLGFARALK